MSYLTVTHHSLWGIRTIVILLVLSPIFILIFLISFTHGVRTDIVSSVYYGKRVSTGARYIRGVIIRINKEGRIATLKTVGEITDDVYIPKSAEFILKLKIVKGGEVKKVIGDYFNRLMVGQTADIELSGNTVFAQKVLVYDLENFTY